MKISVSIFLIVIVGLFFFVEFFHKEYVNEINQLGSSKWKTLTVRDTAHAVGFPNIIFFDKNNGIAQTVFEIKQSADGGKSWRSIYDFDQKGVFTLTHYSDRLVWVVGSDENNKPFILNSRDKGKNWQKVIINEKSLDKINEKFTTFYDICFDQSGKSWIVGDGGILETSIEEQNLSVINLFFTKETLFSVSCNNTGEVWAVGEESAIFHFQNGWTREEIDKKYIFEKIISEGTDIWILGGNNLPVKDTIPLGILLRSQDNGRTWEDKTPDNSGILYDLYLKDGKGWLVGAKGSIYQSSDNGNSWIKSESPTKDDLRDIFFLDSSNGWISGNRATILKYQN